MNKKQQVIQWLDDHKEEQQKLLSDLIRIRSFSGEEYDVQMAVKAYAEKHGFEVETRAFDEDQKRPCVLVTYRGTGDGKCLLLDAHSDTVIIQKDEKWEHDPLAGEFDGTWIHGRGATDDKWGIATALMTLRALKECGVELKGDVQFLSSVGEEVNYLSRRDIGAGAMVKSMEKKPDFCIICEESTKTIGTETPRSVGFWVHVPGKAVHTCVRRQCVYPQNLGIPSGSAVGVDALQKAMIIMDAIYRLERELSTNHRRGGLVGTGGAPDAPRSTIGAVTINPIEIKGGGTNSLMANVSIKYSMHFSATYSHEEMIELLQDTIRGASMTDLWLRENPPVFEVFTKNPGFSSDAKHPAVDVMRKAHAEVVGRDAIVTSWVAGCDADVITPYAPCVVYGPTGFGAHSANERSKLDDLVEAAKVYALTAMDFCK